MKQQKGIRMSNNISNNIVGTTTNQGLAYGQRLNQTSHSAQISQARTDIQRLQSSVLSPTLDQSNSTQNGASLLDIGTPTSTPNPRGVNTTQTNPIEFSSSKISFYQTQTKKLDVLLKEWQGVDTGEAKEQVAKIKSQQASTSAAGSFFSSQKDFWTDESTVKYQAKDLAQVRTLYNKIELLENDYDQSVTSTGSRQNITNINKQLTKVKSELATLRGYETEQPNYKDPNALQENVRSQLQVDSLTEQDEVLQEEQKQLTGKHKGKQKGGLKGKKKKAHLVEITNQRREIASAKKFWSQQAEFWNKLGNAGFSSKDQEQIDQLSFQLTQFEAQMGKVTSSKTNAANRVQIKTTNTQIDEIKAQITDLHTGI